MTKLKEAFDDLEPSEATKVAVLDIGSNSFHLVVARIISGSVQILHKMKQKVRLADGLNEDDYLSEEAIQRGVETLSVFEKSLRGFEPDSVRVVATYTLRKAKNAHKFIKAAASIFPYPIEIISGWEEARLIYNGVAQTNTLLGKNLVIDIGGGSTEFAIGEKFEPNILRSLDMGCVSYTNKFFKKGLLTSKAFKKAITSAQRQLEQIEDAVIKVGWRNCIGTSGSIESMVSMCCDESDVSSYKLTLNDLEKLMAYCIDVGNTEKLELGEVNEQRKQVFAAGLAILIAIFRSLNVSSLQFVSSALREGVIYEMDESLAQQDVRERSAQSLALRYDVDLVHAKQVLDTSFELYNQAKSDWKLGDVRLKPLLGWAALLHEVGLHIHSQGVQKHSAYILRHTDLHGFNDEQQLFLSTLTRFYRKKIRMTEIPEFTLFTELELFQVLILLRLAVLLNIKRQQNFLPKFKFSVNKNTINLAFPKNWLAEHPIIEADLEAEQKSLDKLGFNLQFS